MSCDLPMGLTAGTSSVETGFEPVTSRGCPGSLASELLDSTLLFDHNGCVRARQELRWLLACPNLARRLTGA